MIFSSSSTQVLHVGKFILNSYASTIHMVRSVRMDQYVVLFRCCQLLAIGFGSIDASL